VLGNSEPAASIPGEIVVRTESFTITRLNNLEEGTAAFDSGQIESPGQVKKIQALALKAFFAPLE